MNSETLLLRQVNPSWVQQGRVTSQAFRPTPKDQRRLSVYDGDQIEPAKAWEHYTAALKLASVGVLAVNVEECENQDLSACPDPHHFPEHVVINFEGLGENQIKRKSKHLSAAAASRGWQHQAEGDG